MNRVVVGCVVVGCVTALVLLAGAGSAHAQTHPGMHAFRLGANGAMVVGDQASRSDFGGGGELSYELRFLEFLGVEVGYRPDFFRSTAPGGAGFASYHGLGLGLRLHALGYGSRDVDLWLAAAGDVVFTGNVIRPGLHAQVGIEFFVDEIVRLGPFVGFHHVFQVDQGDLGPGDGSFFTAGLTVTFGTVEGASASEPEPAPEPEPVPAAPAPPPEPPAPVDSDGDGVDDVDDRCVADPEDQDEFEDENGCPDPDNDADGVMDADDRCPAEREVLNGLDDEDGCPDETQTEAELRQITERILFPNDSDRPTPRMHGLITRVARVINENPDWTRIEIEGHASQTGDPEHNLELSRRRAARVRDLLVEHGVAPERLSIAAYGSARPEQDADEAQNRRVTFRIVERRGFENTTVHQTSSSEEEQ